jgi:hypothetical protein
VHPACSHARAHLALPQAASARTLVGTPGKDRLVGSQRAANVINGDGGDDFIDGRR